MGESTSVIALAVAFGFAFLGVLQWAAYMAKENDKERKVLMEELEKQKVLTIDTQHSLNELKITHHDLTLRYNRMASAAKRYKDELELIKKLELPDVKMLTDTEITNIELDVSIENEVIIDIDKAD